MRGKTIHTSRHHRNTNQTNIKTLTHYGRMASIKKNRKK